MLRGHVHLFFGVGFMISLDECKLCTKFKVANFSHCVNIEGNTQILESSTSPGPRPPFLLRVIL